MGKITGITTMIVGASAILAGVGCVLGHYVSGDLMINNNLNVCLAQIAAGLAAFSPGLGKLKVDR